MAKNDQDYLVELGAAIAQRRRSLGLSQADLAYRLDMEVPNLSIIENGRTNPQLLTVARIAAALSCSLAELLPIVDSHSNFLEQRGKYQPLRRKSKGYDD
jgi:transcriptional regulator with XRE-family HTH domain